jgi:hypothetical protein
MKAIKSRFGSRPPTVEQAVEAIAHERGEVIVSNGAAAANALGLTTQVPVRSIYLTSGRSRTMNVGSQKVELKHVPRWQLSLASRPASLYARLPGWGRSERRMLFQASSGSCPRGVQRACCCSTPVSDLARAKRRKGSAWLITSSSSYRAPWRRVFDAPRRPRRPFRTSGLDASIDLTQLREPLACPRMRAGVVTGLLHDSHRCVITHRMQPTTIVRNLI